MDCFRLELALFNVSNEGCLLTCGENMLSWAIFRLLPVAMASDVFGKHTNCVWCQVAWAPVPDFTPAFYTVPRENCGCQDTGK